MRELRDDELEKVSGGLDAGKNEVAVEGLSEPINNIQLRPLSRSQKPDTVAKSRISAAR